MFSYDDVLFLVLLVFASAREDGGFGYETLWWVFDTRLFLLPCVFFRSVTMPRTILRTRDTMECHLYPTFHLRNIFQSLPCK